MADQMDKVKEALKTFEKSKKILEKIWVCGDYTESDADLSARVSSFQELMDFDQKTFGRID